MGPIGCRETSVRIWYYTLRNGLKQRSAHLLRGGSLKYRWILLVLFSSRPVICHTHFCVPPLNVQPKEVLCTNKSGESYLARQVTGGILVASCLKISPHYTLMVIIWAEYILLSQVLPICFRLWHSGTNGRIIKIDIKINPKQRGFFWRFTDLASQYIYLSN